MPRYYSFDAQGPSRSVTKRFERAAGELHPHGKQRILRKRNAGPPKILERSVLSFPLGILRAGIQCSVRGYAVVAPPKRALFFHAT